MGNTACTRKAQVVLRVSTRVLSYGMMKTKTTKNSREGVLPEGLFNEDTKIFFCCSTTGSASQEITLPNKAPFLLFAYDSILCQKVSLSKTNKRSKQTLFEIRLCL